MLKLENNQMDIYSGLLEDLIREDHPYRKLKNLINFRKLLKPLHKLYSKETGAGSIAVESGFKCLLLQFWEDLSDRQMEYALKENVAIKWFCGFSLTEDTPDHSYFGKLRTRIGTSWLSKLFNEINTELGKKGVIGGVFTFVDASGIVSKIALWEERDRAIKEGLDKLNNKNVNKYSSDKDAKFGCKGKKKFWFGYKRHHAVDMKQGIIRKVIVTPANVPDGKVFDRLCPQDSMIFADKAYDNEDCRNALRAKRCHGGIIRKNNNKEKNKDLDKWLTSVRMPFEDNFSKVQRRARYRGTIKVQFQAFLEAMVFNLKRLIKIGAAPIFSYSTG